MHKKFAPPRTPSKIKPFSKVSKIQSNNRAKLNLTSSFHSIRTSPFQNQSRMQRLLPATHSRPPISNFSSPSSHRVPGLGASHLPDTIFSRKFSSKPNDPFQAIVEGNAHLQGVDQIAKGNDDFDEIQKEQSNHLFQAATPNQDMTSDEVKSIGRPPMLIRTPSEEKLASGRTRRTELRQSGRKMQKKQKDHQEKQQKKQIQDTRKDQEENLLYPDFVSFAPDTILDSNQLSRFRTHTGSQRDGVIVDIVKRQLYPDQPSLSLHQSPGLEFLKPNRTESQAAKYTGTQLLETTSSLHLPSNKLDPLLVTRDEFNRRTIIPKKAKHGVKSLAPGSTTTQEIAASYNDANQILHSLLTPTEIALLATSRHQLMQKRGFDITRGSSYAEHIRHVFPCDDFTGSIPPFTDDEIRLLFTRRPRFLNFVTELNPHGFDMSLLHRLVLTPLPSRHELVRKQIIHRYWNLVVVRPQTGISLPDAPYNKRGTLSSEEFSKNVQSKSDEIAHRMHVHRTLNPRSNIFKHFHKKPRSIQQKIQLMDDLDQNVDHGDEMRLGGDVLGDDVKKTKGSKITNRAILASQKIVSQLTKEHNQIRDRLSQENGISREEFELLHRLAKSKTSEIYGLIKYGKSDIAAIDCVFSGPTTTSDISNLQSSDIDTMLTHPILKHVLQLRDVTVDEKGTFQARKDRLAPNILHFLAHLNDSTKREEFIKGQKVKKVKIEKKDKADKADKKDKKDKKDVAGDDIDNDAITDAITGEIELQFLLKLEDTLKKIK